MDAIYCNGIPSNQHIEYTPEYLITFDHVFKMATRDDEREKKLGKGIRVRSQTKEVII